jgi:hypothetical protein
MKWFRKHIKTGARLALFALLIQFALSFGHFHSFAAQAAAAQSDLTQADPAHLATAVAQDTSEKVAQEQQPPNHDSDQPADSCGAGGSCSVRDAAGAAAAADRRTALSDDQRRIRSPEVGASRVPVPRSSPLLISIE